MVNVVCVIDATTNKILSRFIRERYPDQQPFENQIYVPCPSLAVDSVTKDENGNWIFTVSQELLNMYWEKLRTQRNTLLAQSDWTGLTDSPLTTDQKAAWATYRQALRDLPANTPDPSTPIWPTPPQ